MRESSPGLKVEDNVVWAWVSRVVLTELSAFFGA